MVSIDYTKISNAKISKTLKLVHANKIRFKVIILKKGGKQVIIKTFKKGKV